MISDDPTKRKQLKWNAVILCEYPQIQNTIKWVQNIGAYLSCIFHLIQFKHCTPLRCADAQEISKWIDGSHYKQGGMILEIIVQYMVSIMEIQWIHSRNIILQNRRVDQHKHLIYTCGAAELATSNWKNVWYVIFIIPWFDPMCKRYTESSIPCKICTLKKCGNALACTVSFQSKHGQELHDHSTINITCNLGLIAMV